MYKDDGSHVPAIVDEKLWEDANRILEERSKNIKSKKLLISRTIFYRPCTLCGRWSCILVESQNCPRKRCKDRVCSHRIKQGAVSCRSKPVKEEILLEMISDVYNNLAQSNKSILHKYLELYEKELNKTEGTEEKLTTYSMK